MIEIKAKVSKNKNISLSSNMFGNKMDNKITKVIFTEITDEGLLNNKYVLLESPTGNIILLPLNTDDNSFIITTAISSIPGTWKILYLSTDVEVIDGEINNDYKVFISNSFDFNIKDNYIDDTIETEIPDENLKTIYDELNKTVIYLKSEDFKDELISNLKISEEDINKIINALKTDEEFQASVKGEPGYTPQRTIDYWTAEDILAIENYCKEYIDTEILGGVS